MSRLQCLVLFMTALMALPTGRAWARIFDYDDMRIAGYLRSTGGLSQLDDAHFKKSSGEETVFRNRDTSEYNFSAEMGFMLQMGEVLTLRLGVEGLQSRDVTAPGFDDNGDKIMDVKSRVLAIIPNVTLEFNFRHSRQSKAFIFAGLGYAMVKATNTYDMVAGADSKETVSTTSYMGQFGYGYERWLGANVTVAFDIGWRYLVATGLKHDTDVETPAGTFTKGADAVTNTGAKRSLDMGGPFAGVALRFYIPPLN